MIIRVTDPVVSYDAVSDIGPRRTIQGVRFDSDVNRWLALGQFHAVDCGLGLAGIVAVVVLSYTLWPSQLEGCD